MHDDTDEADSSDPIVKDENMDASATTVQHNWRKSNRPSIAIVEAVSAATGQEPTDLPPLQETVDADALDTLLDGQSSSVAVSFQYADTVVSVDADGSIEVRIERRLREEDDE